MRRLHFVLGRRSSHPYRRAAPLPFGVLRLGLDSRRLQLAPRSATMTTVRSLRRRAAPPPSRSRPLRPTGVAATALPPAAVTPPSPTAPRRRLRRAKPSCRSGRRRLRPAAVSTQAVPRAARRPSGAAVPPRRHAQPARADRSRPSLPPSRSAKPPMLKVRCAKTMPTRRSATGRPKARARPHRRMRPRAVRLHHQARRRTTRARPC